jgi:hypothetical protein
MRKKILVTTIFAIFSMALLLPIFAVEAQAADKIGWIGPIYKELSASLNKGFKEYYKKTYGKDVEITFVRPGGWPVVVDKVRAWGGKPDADIFLGAGAPAHEVLKQEGLIVPYRPKNWDKIPAEWHGMKVKDEGDLWTCFAPWNLLRALDQYQSLQREGFETAEATGAENVAGSAQPHLQREHRTYAALRLRHHA